MNERSFAILSEVCSLFIVPVSSEGDIQRICEDIGAIIGDRIGALKGEYNDLLVIVLEMEMEFVVHFVLEF